jgi:uncharacterized protein (DUF58 family)
MQYPEKLEDIVSFTNLELLATQVVEGFITGMHRSPFHGFSVEFAEHRLYNPGESTRFVDWKLYGRTEKLFVKRFEEETNLRANIIIDISSSMLFPYRERMNKLFFSVVCTASLIHMLRTQRDAVGVSLFDDEIRLQTGAKISAVHARWLYGELEKLINPDFNALNRTTKVSDALHLLAESTHRRSLTILFSDFISYEETSDIFSALQHLRFKKHDVIVFHVSDPQYEVELKYSSRPHRFIDMETGDELKLNPNEIRDYYAEKMRKHHEDIVYKCGQNQIDIVEADITKEFSQVLQHFLIKRAKLY